MSDLRNGINRLVGNTKRNRAGNQQPYVPAGNGDESGEYADMIHGSNKHYTNPDKELGVSLTNKGEKPTIETIKSKYDGKGKEVLTNYLKNVLPNSANSKYLISTFENADDEYSGVLGDFLQANPQIEIKLGKNINSKYHYEYKMNRYTGETFDYKWSIRCGKGIIDRDNHYSVGGVFFHETGHALDDSYVDDLGHKGHWSCDYISDKYGVPLKDMIHEEIKNNLPYEKAQELKKSLEIEVEEYVNHKFDTVYGAEYKQLKEQFWQMNDMLAQDETYKRLSAENNEILNEISRSREEWSNDPYNEQKREAFSNAKQTYLTRVRELKNYANQWYESKGYSVDDNIARREELTQLKSKFRNEITYQQCRKYGDLSDMTDGNGSGDICNMGHDKSYWNKSTRNRGKEAFAEMMSAKGTNPESLQVIKEYAPKSVEIFEEIIEKIKSGKNQYRKAQL